MDIFYTTAFHTTIAVLSVAFFVYFLGWLVFTYIIIHDDDKNWGPAGFTKDKVIVSMQWALAWPWLLKLFLVLKPEEKRLKKILYHPRRKKQDE